MKHIFKSKQNSLNVTVNDLAQAHDLYNNFVLNKMNSVRCVRDPFNGLLLLIFFAILLAWPLTASAQVPLITPKGRPPSKHMPPPDKDEKPSPGPMRDIGSALSHRTIDGYDAICSDQYATYDTGNWQYAIFSTCTYVSDRQILHVTIVVKEAQYYWGAWYYNGYAMNIVGLNIQLNLPGESPIVWTPPATVGGTGKEYNFNFQTSLPCSGNYTVAIAGGSLQGMYYPQAEWAIPLPQMQVAQPNGPTGQDSLNQIWSAMRANPSIPLAYQFGEGFEVPKKSAGQLCSIQQPGTLLVVQHASSLPSSGQGQLKPYLLGDMHTGPAKRCEMNPLAVVGDGTKEAAEIFTPAAAWGRLGGPDFAINTNYFDVRSQIGTTWLQTQCSVPLGVYYDNNPDGPTGGTHNTPEKYLAGPGYFVDKDDNKAPEDTFFWVYRTGLNPMVTFTMTRSSTPDSNAAIAQADRYDSSGLTFVAFSGTALIPAHYAGPAPDSGNVSTTRIGIGYDGTQDILYIFEGGTYQKGVDRGTLTGIFQALGATTAMEIDGGGSAALVIRDGSATWAGLPSPSTSCPNSGAWCSPVTQPDGKARPVPSWLGMSFSH
jgi:Phosphodiester glycosidase